MRAYTVITTALALGVDHKWLDNLLSHNTVPGIARSQRGVRRRIPPRSVSIIALAHRLHTALSIPVHRAVEIATELMDSPDGEQQVAAFLSLRIERESFVADVARRLDDAAEFAAVPPRGRRPRGRTSSGP